MNRTIIAALSVILLVSCNTQLKNNSKKDSNMVNEKNTTESLKSIAQKAQHAFFGDYSVEGVKKYFSKDYIQHNPHVPTGIAPVIGFLPVLEKANTTYATHRLIQDENFIVFHNTYHNAEAFGAKEVVAFDIWRMEDGMVAEHWDAVVPKVAKSETASGRSQTDGPTEIMDLDKTNENKRLIRRFIKDVLQGENPLRIFDYISSEQYDQHNIYVKDGLDGILEAVKHLTEQNNMFKYNTIHKVLGEGNFVLAQSEGEWNGKPQAFYDLFRIENGKIVEHWDVIQEIPAEMAHNNGMF